VLSGPNFSSYDPQDLFGREPNCLQRRKAHDLGLSHVQTSRDCIRVL
jgi:hypothetical protein